MVHKTSFRLAAITTLATVAAFSQSETLTGTGVKVKTVALVDVNQYRISHYMQQLPAMKTPQAVVDAETNKRFDLAMLRDIDQASFVRALKDSFAVNAYADNAKIGQFLAAFSGSLKEKSHVAIGYDSGLKSTTVKVESGGSATVAGTEFMKAVWRIWLGRTDQPSLPWQLISKIP